MANRNYTFRFKKNEETSEKRYVITATTTEGGGRTTTFTIIQAAAEAKSFKWSNGDTAITVTAEYNTRRIEEGYTIAGYNRSDLRITCDTIGCSGRLDSSGKFIGTLMTNNGDARDIVFQVMYNGTSIATLTVHQNAKPEKKYFWIGESGKTIYTTDPVLEATATSVTINYLTNYTSEELINFTSAATVFNWIKSLVITPSSDTGGTVNIVIDENTATTQNNGFVHIKKDGYINIATINIKQKGRDRGFVWNSNNSDRLTVTATTPTVSEAYTTNYTNLTVMYTNKVSTAQLSATQGSGIATATMNENTEGDVVESNLTVLSNGTQRGWLKIIQNAGETKYFYFNTNSATTIDLPEFIANASYTTSSPFEVTVYTNYTTSELRCDIGGFVDSATISNISGNQGKVQITFGVNTGVERNGIVKVYKNGTDTVLGTINLKQKGVTAKYFYWIDGTNSATTILIEETAATATAHDVTYITNYPELSLTSEYFGSVVTGFIPTSLTETEVVQTLHIEFTPNVSTTMNQTDTIYVKDGNNVVGMINLLQYPKGSTNDWFKWVINGENVYNLPGYVSKDGYDIEFEYETNVEGLSFYCDHQDWFDEGETPHIKEDGGKYYCKAKLTQNAEEDVRNVVILAQKGSETVGRLTMKQDVTVAEPYIWIVSTGNTGATYESPYTANSSGFTILTNYNQSKLNSLSVVKIDDVNWITNVNLSKGTPPAGGLRFNILRNDDKDNGRTGIISVLSPEDVELLRVTINQEANNDKEFKWTAGSITANTATTMTSDSGESNVTVTYETDYENLSVTVDEAYPWVKNATVDTANNAVTYHLDVYSDPSYNPLRGVDAIKLYSGTKLIGRITVVQEPAPEPDKYFRFKYNGEETEASTLEISNVPATLTDQTRQFTVSALTNYAASVFNLEVDSSLGSGWLTNVNKGNVDTTGFTITFDVGNNTGDERTGYIYLKKNGSVYRTIKVIQREMTYEFSWVQGSIETSKSIGPVGTGATSETVPFYSTYPNITIDNPSQNGISCYMNGTSAVRYSTTQRGATEYDIRSATFNLMSNGRIIGTLTVRQEGQVAPLKFQWDNGTNYKEITIDYNRETLNETYTREPNDNTYLLGLFADTNNPQGMAGTMYLWSTSVSISINEFSAEASQNRRAVFYVKASDNGEPTMDSPTYGTLVVNQTPKPYFYWGTGTETATTMTIPVTGALGTGQSVTFRTNYTSLTADDVQNNIFLGRSLNLGTKKFSVIANPNETIAEKSQTFKIYNNGNEVGRIAVTQTGADPVFKWTSGGGVTGGTATTISNLAVGGASVNAAYMNNYLNVQLVTAGTPSWITNAKVNSTTGNSEFSCTIGSSDEITARTYTFTICGQTNNYSSSRRIIGTITVSQAAATPRFKWVNSQQVNDSGSTTDTGISWSTEYYYDTNYSGITCSVSSDPNTLVSSASVNRSDGSGYLHILTKTNDTQNSKVCIIDIKSNGSTLGQFSFEQAAPNPYFAWGSSTGPNSTAITVSTSSQAANKSYYTNYTGLTITFSSGDDLLQASSLTSSLFSVTASTNQETRERSGVYNVKGKWNGSESNIGSITVKQAAAASWFTWSNGDTADTIENISAAGSPFSEGYLTNDSNPTTTYTLSANTTLTPNVGWGANNTVTGNVSEYTVITGTGRTLTVYVKKGTTRVATLTIKQLPATGVFEWVAGGSLGSITSDKKSATTTTLGSGIVNFVANFNTNYSSLSATKQNDQISPTSTGCSVTYSVLSGKTSENATTNQRSVEFIVKNGSNELGYLKVVQAASSPYFQWSNGETAMTVNIKSGATIASANCSSNMSSLGAVHKSGTSYISSPSVTTSKFTASTTANNTMNDRTETFNIYSGSSTSNVVGEITFIQAAGPYISWDSSSIVTTSSTTKYAAAASTSDITINYYTNISSTTAIKLSGSVSSSSSILSSSAISTTNKTITFRLKENTSTADRSETIYIYSGSSYSKHYLCELTINQAGASTPPTPTTRTLTINAANNFKFEVQGYAPFQDDEVEYLIATANSTSVGDAINFYGKLVTGTSVTFNTSGSITLNNQPTSQVTVTLYVVPYRGERTMHLVGYGWMDGVSFYSNHSTVTSGNNSFSVTFNAGTNSITLESRNPNGEIKNT